MATYILYNGPIYTLDPAMPRVPALAIRDGRIIAVGSEGKVQASAGGRAMPINLKGRAVVPGLADAHVHILHYGLARTQVILDPAPLDTTLDRIAAHATAQPPDGWVLGTGWDHTTWGRWPTCGDLDAATNGRPAYLTRKDGHSAWVSTRALALAGIDDSTPDPPGGHIQRDAQGHASGVLVEKAMELVLGVVQPPSPDQRMAALGIALQEALSYGITGIHVPTWPAPGDTRNNVHDLQVLHERGDLKLRALVHIGLDDMENAIRLGLRSGMGDDWLRIGAIKLFADGSLGSETAELLAPYEGRGHCGTAMLDEAELNLAISMANGAGFAVAVHAIGDAANRKVLDAMAAATSTSRMPNRIEHVQLIDPADLPRLAELGVIASMQPVHATSDMDMAERLWGPRCANAYALRSVRASGAVLALGSDAPVESLNPWWGIHAAVTRRRRGDARQGWYPEQCLSVAEALEGYCIGPAIASAEQDDKGTLVPGKRADLAVLSADPFQIRVDEIHTICAELTMVDGEIVFQR